MDIPYIFYASRGLYQKPVVLDIVNYLRSSTITTKARPFTVSWPVRSLISGMTTSSSSRTRHRRAPGRSTNRAARPRPWASVPKAWRKSAASSASSTKHTLLARSRDVRGVIFAFLEDTGYLRRIVAEGGELSKETTDYINQFWRVVQEFVDAEHDPSAKLFLERIRLQIEAGEEGKLAFDPDVGPEAVRVMTVHAAKGLEFDYVFLVSLIDRRFPSSERSEAIELPRPLVKEILPEGDHHMEEERRLFYVGMTRAKKGLFLTSADDYGGTRKRKPSVFLGELGFKDPSAAVAGNGAESESVLAPSEAARPLDIAKYLPKTLSFSQITAFENCPLQYKFAHILKIPVKGKGFFSFGKTMHAAMEKLFTLVAERQKSDQGSLFGSPSAPLGADIGKAKSVGELVKEDELDGIFEASWIDDWFDDAGQKETYRAKGRRQLRAYYERIKGEIIVPAGLEQKFMLKIDGVGLFGLIDRVDALPDGTVRVVDYKTGTPKKEEDVGFEEKRQLLIYQLACLDSLGKRPSSLLYVYLEDASQAEFLGTEKELEKMRGQIVAVDKKLKSSDFAADPSSHKCKHCDFRDICEFRVCKSFQVKYQLSTVSRPETPTFGRSTISRGRWTCNLKPET